MQYLDGIGKRTPFDDPETKEPVYRKQTRGGKGVIAIATEVGVAGALSVQEEDEVMLLTKGGQSIRTKVSDIRCTAGRNTKGVRVMRLKDGEALLGISKVERSDEEEENAAKPQA